MFDSGRSSRPIWGFLGGYQPAKQCICSLTASVLATADISSKCTATEVIGVRGALVKEETADHEHHRSSSNIAILGLNNTRSCSQLQRLVLIRRPSPLTRIWASLSIPTLSNSLIKAWGCATVRMCEVRSHYEPKIAG